MTIKQLVKVAGVVGTFVAIVLAGMLVSPRVRAQHDHDKDNERDHDSTESKIQIGFQIAPVKLSLAGKDQALVGLGSYIVNGQGDCNGCHNSGTLPNFEYLPGGNPYFNQRKVVNPATYLGGGQNFGPVGPPPSPDIITRNLTPDKAGRPEGGHTFAEFRQMMRNGTDFDQLHPNCTAARTTNCIPAFTGIDGDLLQIMPWPVFQNMTDRDLLAIYTYLSAIPCIDTLLPGQPELRNDCR